MISRHSIRLSFKFFKGAGAFSEQGLNIKYILSIMKLLLIEVRLSDHQVFWIVSSLWKCANLNHQVILGYMILLKTTMW